MDASKILSADWLDILFEGKNKSYGAYDLRKTYVKRMVLALAALLLLIVVVGASVVVGNNNKKTSNVLVEEVHLAKVNTPKKKEEPKKPEPKKEKPKPQSKAPAPKGKKSPEAPVKLAVKQYTPPKIVEHPDQSKKLASMKDLLDKKIGTFNQEGLKTELNAGPALQVEGEGGTGFGTGGGGTGNIAGGSGEGDGTGFVSVQQEAAYDGNFQRFLEINLRRDLPGENGAPNGNYTVRVQFTVAKDGSISNIKALNDPGYGTADEACRAIRTSKKWKPAIQNGRPVETKKIQAITFQVTE